MRESIHKYFQVGTIRWMSFPKMGVVESVKRIASDDYFDAVEITQCKDEEERKAVKEILEQSHLKVCYGAQPRLLGPKLNPNDLNEEGRKRRKPHSLRLLTRRNIWEQRELPFWQESGRRAQKTWLTGSF